MSPLPADYRLGLRLSERGEVTAIGDGIAWVRGLPSARLDELVGFEGGGTGLVFQLGQDQLGTILLDAGAGAGVSAGMGVHPQGRDLDIGCGEALLGRTIDPLGQPLDGLPAPATRTRRALEAEAPAILERDFVTRPLYTGNKIVDALIPVGKGQRQLLIGDDGLGKSSFALDCVINQLGRDVRCVVVLIGQSRASVAGVQATLRESGALAHTVLVVAEANALPGVRYLAPFAGCALAEHWLRAGHDVLVVYDDLSRHAQAYRELALLLHRPPGREAFPGDIFHLHARLLERATQLRPDLGGGSLTALPIIETRQGELSAYIPTNLISITDGQIYLDSRLFSAGMLPAIDIGRSVSRIGGKAQHPAIKAAAARIRLDYLQFLELESFSRFGTRLDPAIEARLARGRQLRALLKQDRLAPLPETAHLAWLLAYGEGLLGARAPEAAAACLPGLYKAVHEAGLDLHSPKPRWLQVLAAALAASP